MNDSERLAILAPQMALLRRAVRDRRKPCNRDGLDPSCIEVLELYIGVADETGAATLSASMIAEAVKIDRRTAICCRQHLVARGYLLDTGEVDNGTPTLLLSGGGLQTTPPPASGLQTTRSASGLQTTPPPASGLQTTPSQLVVSRPPPKQAAGKKPRKPKALPVPRAAKSECGKRVTGDNLPSSLEVSPSETHSDRPVYGGDSSNSLPAKPKRGDPPTPTELAQFDQVWREYPRPVARDLALKAFVKRVRGTDDADAIIRAAKFWRDAFDKECQRLKPTTHERNIIVYAIPHLETWLKERRFMDQPLFNSHKVEGKRMAEAIRKERQQPQPRPDGRLPERKANAPMVGSPEWHRRNRELGIT
jgi:hypothetical protein